MARERYNRPALIDRVTTCPFLVRVFVKHGSHHQDTDYSTTKTPPAEEFQLYTWKDSSVRELMLLLRDAAPNLRESAYARFSIKFVYFDQKRERYNLREFASISARDVIDTRGGFSTRADKTLEEGNYVVGDYIDVAYIINPSSTSDLGRNSYSSSSNYNNSGSNQYQNRNDRGGFPSRGRGTSSRGRGGHDFPSRSGDYRSSSDYNRAGDFGGRNDNRNDKRRDSRDNWAPAPHLTSRINDSSNNNSGQAPAGAWGRNKNNSNSDRRGRDEDSNGRRRRDDSRSVSPRRNNRD